MLLQNKQKQSSLILMQSVTECSGFVVERKKTLVNAANVFTISQLMQRSWKHCMLHSG